MKDTRARTALKKTGLMVLVATILTLISLQVSAQLVYTNISNPVICIICLIYGVFIYVAASLAALVFVAAAVQWIASRDDPAKRKAALDIMVHAVIGLLLVGVGNTIVMSVIGPVLGIAIEGCQFGGAPWSAGRGCTYSAGNGGATPLLLPLFDALKPL